MNDKEKDQLREKMSAEVVKTKESIKSLEKTTKPIPPDDAIGRLTRMEAINAKSVSEASLNAARIKLAKIERALKKLDDPEFGTCAICEEPIPIRRIMLMPETTVCVRCAEK